MAPLHAILASQRSGTTLFRSILNSHPQVQAFDEVYGGMRPQREPNYLRYLVEQVSRDPLMAVPSAENMANLFQGHLSKLEALSPRASVRIVDVKYTHVHRFNRLNQHRLELPYLLECIQGTKGGVLHVIRRNLLATHVSATIAKRNASHRAAKEDLVSETRVALDPDATLRELEKRESEINHFKDILANVASVQEIYYEDMIVDGMFSEAILSDLARRWCIDMSFQRQPEREKIVPPLHEAILNFDEIESRLAATQFAWMTTS